MFLILLALVCGLASTALCAEDRSGECMEKCLQPAIEAGDPERLKDAIERCESQCMPPLVGENTLPAAGTAANAMTGYQRGRCISQCASQNRQCLITKRSPKQCHIAYENCKKGCR